MIIERPMQNILDRVIKNLKIEMDILDLNGRIVASSDKSKVGQEDTFVEDRTSIENKSGFTFRGRTYMKINAGFKKIYYLSTDGVDLVSRNYSILTVSLLELYLKNTINRMNKEDILSSAMQRTMSLLELQDALELYEIEEDLPRCVFVIRTEGMKATEVYRIMEDVFSESTKDHLMVLDSHSLALVKQMTEDLDDEELVQLGIALEETILNEVNVRSYVGIGTVFNNIFDISKSYEEAIDAIEIGSIFDKNKRVYYYDTLLLERFLREVPLDISEKYYRRIFDKEFEKTLTDEMIMTIERFFDNNLNLSETSRQLYIHRNTLVYRLDKIQKIMNLDLRNFHDAVTFKIMIMLERQERECSEIDRV